MPKGERFHDGIEVFPKGICVEAHQIQRDVIHFFEVWHDRPTATNEHRDVGSNVEIIMPTKTRKLEENQPWFPAPFTLLQHDIALLINPTARQEARIELWLLKSKQSFDCCDVEFGVVHVHSITMELILRTDAADIIMLMRGSPHLN